MPTITELAHQIVHLNRRKLALDAELARLRARLAEVTVPGFALPVEEFVLRTEAGRARVVVDDLDAVPDLFVLRRPDATAIRKAWRSGQPVPGARVVPGNPMVRVCRREVDAPLPHG